MTELTAQERQQMEAAVTNNHTNYQAAFNLAITYLQMRETNRAVAVLERIVNNPRVDPSALIVVAPSTIIAGA